MSQYSLRAGVTIDRRSPAQAEAWRIPGTPPHDEARGAGSSRTPSPSARGTMIRPAAHARTLYTSMRALTGPVMTKLHPRGARAPDGAIPCTLTVRAWTLCHAASAPVDQTTAGAQATSLVRHLSPRCRPRSPRSHRRRAWVPPPRGPSGPGLASPAHASPPRVGRAPPTHSARDTASAACCRAADLPPGSQGSGSARPAACAMPPPRRPRARARPPPRSPS